VCSEDLRSLEPEASQLTTAHSSGKVHGAIVTVRYSSSSSSTSLPAAAAAADDDVCYDFASRYFAPWVGINEDSVTGELFLKKSYEIRDNRKNSFKN